jgi:hypothetical protein
MREGETCDQALDYTERRERRERRESKNWSSGLLAVSATKKVW